ncbi:MAG: AAA family ATPase, partial [Lachnospiraceae bacterium]
KESESLRNKGLEIPRDHYIEKGVTTTAENLEFQRFLEKGEITFGSVEEMESFLHALSPLFQVEERTVVDKQKVKAIEKKAEENPVIWPEQISEPLKKKIFGQEEAIEELADAISVHQLSKEEKPLIFAMVGPPATGKSETARSLADIMTQTSGHAYGYIEVGGNEFVGEHMIHRFLGAPAGYVGHGEKTILDPVRQNPYHVIVINEIEKSNDKLLIALMEAMETGYLGMADNSQPIDLRRTILIFTSNLPIDMKKYTALSEPERAEYCKDVFTKHCGRPEISRRISWFLVFRELSSEATIDIVVKFAQEALKSYEASLAYIDEYLMADFLKHQTKYGASEIKNRVSRAIGKKMLQSRNLNLVKGKAVSLKGTIENIEFEFR